MQRIKINFQSNLLFSRLSIVSSLRNLADIKIFCENQKIVDTNKTILSVFCPYFEKMFQVAKAGVVVLPHITIQVFESFLKLILDGHVEIEKEMLKPMIDCVKFLEVDTLFPDILSELGEYLLNFPNLYTLKKTLPFRF